MPSDYAHYRFGSLALPTLPKDVQRSVSRFRRLYDVGQHGPDIFFHYNILHSNPIGKLASDMHQETGEVFFTRACRHLRRHPSEAGTVYLYGFLGHFCLDSICHPYVHQHTDEGPIGHTELEREFDRFLMVLDKRPHPSTLDISKHMRLSRNEAATAAEILHPVTAAQIHRSAHNMAMHTHLLATVNQKVLHLVLDKQKKEIADQLVPELENTHCSFLDAEFLELYNHALEIYPQMLRQLQAHMDHRAPFGEEFKLIYG